MERRKGLVVVDVQNDFCPGGALAVKDGDQVVLSLNRIITAAADDGWEIFFSRDWHPPKTKHFAIWPPHCVQETPGARFHPDLHFPPDPRSYRVISKGLNDADDYSAFDGGMRPEAHHLYVGGLATDYCVKWTVNRGLELGHAVTLLADACRAVDLKTGDGERAIAEMVKNGAHLSTTEEVLRELAA